MRIKLKETPEQIELIRAMGSKDPAVSRPAQEAFAGFIGPVVARVLAQAGSANLIYTDWPYNEDEDPSFPLDLYYDKGQNHVQVWTQNMAGGLPSSHIEGTQEMKIATYNLTSAVDLNKKYARRARLPVVNLAIQRMTQELLLKQERNAWAVLLKALSEASTNGNDHINGATTANILQLNDFNALITLGKRINVSWAGGTPDSSESRGITDLFMSPEMTEQIRGFAYQPMNQRAGASNGTNWATAVPLPDAVRERIFNASGNQEIYGIGITELNELGIGQKYNILFDTFYSGSAPTFTVASDEIVVGLDLGREACIRPIAQNADTGATATVLPDNQWNETRVDKMGWFLTVEEGRVVVDSRAILGLVV